MIVKSSTYLKKYNSYITDVHLYKKIIANDYEYQWPLQSENYKKLIWIAVFRLYNSAVDKTK